MLDGIYNCKNNVFWMEPRWKEPEMVSVIVTISGDYGRFVAKCLDSIYAQTYPNFEVILADDDTRDMPDISSYKLRHYKVDFHHANKTRNYAFSKVKGKLVMFVDADDWLYEKTTISKLVSRLKAEDSVSCGHFRVIDYSGKDITPGSFPKSFDLERLYHYNYIQTTAIIRKKDFVGFDESLEQFQDWDLFVRLALAGKKFAYHTDPVICHYQHGNNMQSRYVTRWEGKDGVKYLTTEEYKNIYRDILYKNMVLTVSTAFSGKLWCFEKYFKRLSELKFAKSKTRLVFFDDSDNPKFTKLLKKKMKKIRSKYKEVVYMTGGVKPIGYEPYPVAVHVSQLYNRMRHEMIKGTHCYVWEDDEIPPRDVIEKLNSHLWADVGIVSGYAKSRQFKKPLAWYWNGQLQQAYQNGKQVEEVGAVGIGCALIPSVHVKYHAFRGTNGPNELGQDIVFCRDLVRSGAKILIDWSVKVIHLDRNGVISPKIKLHLGCGWDYKTDYINVDKSKYCPTDDELDLSEPLPYPEDSVDLIETHHFIEHIPTHLGTKDYKAEFLPILRDWHRVLRSDGKIVIECPDFDALITMYSKAPKKRDDLLKHIYGYGGEGQYHYMGWSFNRLKTVLSSAGFKHIKKCKARDYHAKQSPCLRVEAIKE